MAFTGLRETLEQFRDAIVVAYSLVVMATTIPGFGHISNLIVLPFYALVPGYYATLLLRSSGTIMDAFFYSVAWSLAILTSVYAIITLLPGLVPISIIVPAFTIALLVFAHFRK